MEWNYSYPKEAADGKLVTVWNSEAYERTLKNGSYSVNGKGFKATIGPNEQRLEIGK